MILPVQNRGGVGSSGIKFQSHLPRNFSSMMNYIYKNAPDIFEYTNSMRVSTILESGKEVSGTVNFLNGKYHGLVMDAGFEKFAQEFKRTALKRYNMKIAKRQLIEKLGYKS